MITLYESPISPYVRKVKMVLHEKGLPYESRLIDLFAEEQRKPEYLALNPFHRVPVLRDGDAVLFESTAIAEYLDEVYPQPPLLPREPAARAQARAWEEVSDSYFGQVLSGLVQENFVKPGGPDSKTVEQLKNQLAEYLQALDRQLDGKPFVAGSLSLADIALVMPLSLLAMFGVTVDAYPNVSRWLASIQARESFQKAQPSPEFMMQMMARIQERRAAQG